ncbi:MAG: hypothetical protein ACKN94_13810 [Pirellulaceae bacterium]
MKQPSFAIDRRGVLRMAGMGVAGSLLPLPHASQAGQQPGEDGFGQAKSVLLVLLSGGPSQLDTLDPKPDAPVRCEANSGRSGQPSLGFGSASICRDWPDRPIAGRSSARWLIGSTTIFWLPMWR